MPQLRGYVGEGRAFREKLAGERMPQVMELLHITNPAEFRKIRQVVILTS